MIRPRRLYDRGSHHYRSKDWPSWLERDSKGHWFDKRTGEPVKAMSVKDFLEAHSENRHEECSHCANAIHHAAGEGGEMSYTEELNATIQNLEARLARASGALQEWSLVHVKQSESLALAVKALEEIAKKNGYVDSGMVAKEALALLKGQDK